MKIFSLQGPHAVGKTTLFKNLINSYNDLSFGRLHFNKKDKVQIEGIVLSNYSDFRLNQECYFKQEQYRWHQLKEEVCEGIVLDRGPEDTICFSYTYPRFINANWNIDDLIPGFISKYIHQFSNKIIYLYATYEIIQKRMDSSVNRKRQVFEEREALFVLEKRYYESLGNTIFIDTSALSAADLVNQVMEIIRQDLSS